MTGAHALIVSMVWRGVGASLTAWARLYKSMPRDSNGGVGGALPRWHKAGGWSYRPHGWNGWYLGLAMN